MTDTTDKNDRMKAQMRDAFAPWALSTLEEPAKEAGQTRVCITFIKTGVQAIEVEPYSGPYSGAYPADRLEHDLPDLHAAIVEIVEEAGELFDDGTVPPTIEWGVPRPPNKLLVELHFDWDDEQVTELHDSYFDDTLDDPWGNLLEQIENDLSNILDNLDHAPRTIALYRPNIYIAAAKP